MKQVPGPLTFRDVLWLLERLSRIEGVILVGGQAVDCWCEHYLERSAALRAGGPYASKDVDLLASGPVVERIARELGGEFRVPEPFEPTPSAGVVRYRDPGGVERTLDVLRELFGVAEEEARDTAVEVTLIGPRDRFGFRVLHPGLCLESRARNLVGLPGYDGDHARLQLRASLICVTEVARDLVRGRRPRPALRLFERVFRLADSRVGDEVVQRAGIEILDAVAPLQGLPEDFRKIRYPRMRARIDSRRRRNRC
ncbi:MAG: hypothetical protein HYY06_20575 [Deltaproteobacteria bacterium]|nr:hypothetical protein [Deltaproteobacteria bacterium]